MAPMMVASPCSGWCQYSKRCATNMVAAARAESRAAVRYKVLPLSPGRRSARSSKSRGRQIQVCRGAPAVRTRGKVFYSCCFLSDVHKPPRRARAPMFIFTAKAGTQDAFFGGNLKKIECQRRGGQRQQGSGVAQPHAPAGEDEPHAGVHGVARAAVDAVRGKLAAARGGEGVVRACQKLCSPASAMALPAAASSSAAPQMSALPPADQSCAAGTARTAQSMRAAAAASMTGGGMRHSYQRGKALAGRGGKAGAEGKADGVCMTLSMGARRRKGSAAKPALRGRPPPSPSSYSRTALGAACQCPLILLEG